jgi:hypothetical protein
MSIQTNKADNKWASYKTLRYDDAHEAAKARSWGND